jgi:hypothetical protein
MMAFVDWINPKCRSSRGSFYFCWYETVGGKVSCQTYDATVISPKSLQKHQITAAEANLPLVELAKIYPYIGGEE